MKAIIGHAGNEQKFLALLEVIERSQIRDRIPGWTVRGMLPSLGPGSTDSFADLKFYNLFTSRFISEAEAHAVSHRMDPRVPIGHPTGWDLADVAETFVRSVNDLQWLHVVVDRWGDAVDGETDDDNDNSESVLEKRAQPRNLTEMERLKAMRGYLHRVGEVPESVLSGEYYALVAYLKGCLHRVGSLPSLF